jgi:hypothetical protein
MLRLPRGALDLETARRYLVGDAASARAKGGAAILYFLSEDEFGVRVKTGLSDGDRSIYLVTSFYSDPELDSNRRPKCLL